MTFLQRIARRLYQFDLLEQRTARLEQGMERVREALGRIEARQVATLRPANFSNQEFRAFSQWGEDGIIQFLIRQVPIARPVFVEFGVENYTESNTRFLLINNRWEGLVIDGSAENISFIQNDSVAWRHRLKAVHGFVTRENINEIVRNSGIEGEIGLLSVDIDGNDYWVWEAITAVTPALVVAEYNSIFGPDRAVTVPYDPTFQRDRAHHSQIYYGASLAALVGLGRRKGYVFVGVNSAGNNAFFVRRDLHSAGLPDLNAADGFVARQFRETRTADGRLAFLTPEEEATLIGGLPLVEVEK